MKANLAQQPQWGKCLSPKNIHFISGLTLASPFEGA